MAATVLNSPRAIETSLFAPAKRLRPILALLVADVLRGDPESVLPAGCAIEMVHTASLVLDDLPCMDDAETRRKFGLEGQPTAADVAEVEKSMKAEGQLDVSKFPMITFTSTTITPETAARYLVAGQLTIRGVTRAVQFPANVVMEGNVFRATATLTFMQSAFGYKPYSALLGAIRNKDAVRLHIDLVAVPE